MSLCGTSDPAAPRLLSLLQVSAVEAFAQHGDPAVHACMLRVLQHICRPLLHMVHGWVFDGRLQDAGGDFFVSKDLDAATGQ